METLKHFVSRNAFDIEGSWRQGPSNNFSADGLIKNARRLFSQRQSVGRARRDKN